jgi:hypothetical protein
MVCPRVDECQAGQVAHRTKRDGPHIHDGTIQPWSRFRSPKKWTAELEILVAVLNLLFVFAFIRHLDLHIHSHLSLPISREQISAISIVSGVLLFVIRGGTYIVRGCLRKTETLPKLSVDQQPESCLLPNLLVAGLSPLRNVPGCVRPWLVRLDGPRNKINKTDRG